MRSKADVGADQEICQAGGVTNTPVCVVGLGLIGGSVMRAAAAAGREVFGYNRSIEAVQAATADGFDATENLDEALSRAAARQRTHRALPCRCPRCHRCWAASAIWRPNAP